MKFGHDFKRALENDMPPGWGEAAIQYKALKKCIKRFVFELSSLGLSAETISKLMAPTTVDPQQAITLSYSLGKEGHIVVPKIIINVNFDKLKTDKFAASMFKQLNASNMITTVRSNYASNVPSTPSDSTQQPPTNTLPSVSASSQSVETCETVDEDIDTQTMSSDMSEVQSMEISLNCDHEFFEKLTSELQSVEGLQREQRKILFNAIDILSHEISLIASPNSKKKYKSLYCWRKIFEIYMDSDIFISCKEADQSHERTPELAERHLKWFDDQVRLAKCLPSSSKHRDRILYAKFLELNESLLKVASFQQMNKLAVTKIMKKFDKRTSLTAQPLFFQVIESDPLLLVDNASKAICFSLSSKLFSIIPQLRDFECAICSNVAYKPVRLGCSHVFCLHCLIILQKQKVDFCPLCRAKEVMKADSRNIDHALMNFMKTYFPREIKEKFEENENDTFTPSSISVVSGQNNCVIM
ncbi:ubiquitin-protein ligase E3 with SPX domain Pqr1/Spx1 [Schizosaccharomyces pombe]|uniref:E3 ubiquitin-protein ligase pqr1 n=1 Tax=Schizosaccharomyces pombe (strain 972 / ATCC 24843) TaxID=284812 RepID=PQR1_SCHPO|nr:putative ubiquitin-protein ligase E3 [Schizosaccharomyces pombe]O14212.2 RecName: Full=Uncharacterized RING finger protein C6B12.07c [Schizosaccharomyces pombe 972h-]CAB11077.2 ubiquitin-protein ligase E3 (predicted) [Schizosaccharomyces pombe]|eukprot:NP_593762.2 putative ubiquitin-protein ligase E3 [Schizosaccharomyces pombe]